MGHWNIFTPQLRHFRMNWNMWDMSMPENIVRPETLAVVFRMMSTRLQMLTSYLLKLKSYISTISQFSARKLVLFIECCMYNILESNWLWICYITFVQCTYGQCMAKWRPRNRFVDLWIVYLITHLILFVIILWIKAMPSRRSTIKYKV